MTPRDAAHKTMDEVGAAVIAIALVLSAVFIPTAFIPGITGQFYRQFALTIAVSTMISAFNSLTLSPALGALLLKPHDAHARAAVLRCRAACAGWPTASTAASTARSRGYARSVGCVARRKAFMLLVYAGLLGVTVCMAQRVPSGFIPQLDQGYAIVVIQLPDGASLSRTDAVVRRASEIIRRRPGVINAVAFAGFSGATFTNATNAAAIFVGLRAVRGAAARQASRPTAIIGQLFGAPAADRGGLHHRHPAAAGAAASATPAASRCRSRTAPATRWARCSAPPTR